MYKKSKSVKKSLLVKKVKFEDDSLLCTDKQSEELSNEMLFSFLLESGTTSHSYTENKLLKLKTYEQSEEFSNEMLFSFLLESSEYIDLNENKLLKLKANDEMLNNINLIIEHMHKIIVK